MNVKNRQMRGLVGASLVAASLAVAAPAAAEGHWDSYISGASQGFLSRVWTDNNTDGTSTSVRFTDCNLTWVYVNVYRQVAGIDPSVGALGDMCPNAREYWGDLPADEYRFKIDVIGNSGTLNVRDVDVWY